MKRLFIILSILIFFALLAVAIKAQKNGAIKLLRNNNPSVVTSFYPLWYFVDQIGKDKITTTNITPAGAEPHDYEPTTQDVVMLSHAALVIVNGVGLEPWSSKIETPNLVSVSDALPLKDLVEDGEKIKDPHTWLDPVLAQEMVKKITKELSLVSPENSDYFATNEAQLIARLKQLDSQFKNVLSRCAQQSVITSHAAFGYLASRYHFSQIPISGVSPEEEPSPQKLAEIAKLVSKNNMSYIFFETLVSPRLAETIALETNAKTLVFNPLEGLTREEEAQGEDYFTIQTQNLQNLKTALGCM